MRPFPLVLTLVLALFVVPACDPPPAPPATVAIVGIDGGDWDVLDPLIQAGHLPALAWMRERGATARLEISSAKSPESWTTIATGHRPEAHGITQSDNDALAGFSAPPDQLQVKRLWDMAGERGKRVLVVDWWITSPPYPVNGVLVSRESMESYPPGAIEKSLEPIRPEKHAEAMKRLGLGAARTGTMKYHMARGEFDLLMLPTYAVDHALHQLWSELQVGSDPEALAALEPPVRARVQKGFEMVLESIRLFDTLLGHAYHTVGDDGYVLVVSDHGFDRADPVVRRIAVSRSILDGGQGTAEEGIFQGNGVSFRLESSQEAVSGPVPALNYQLRWPKITLEGPNARRTRTRLLALRTDADEPVFVARGSTLQPGPAVREAAGEALGQIREEAYSIFVNSGAHQVSDRGVFGLYGPDVRPGEMSRPVHTEDITPTALWLLGLPTGEDLEGEPVTRALNQYGQDRRPVETIPTWEDGTRPWAVPGRNELTVQERERLKALGYLQ